MVEYCYVHCFDDANRARTVYHKLSGLKRKLQFLGRIELRKAETEVPYPHWVVIYCPGLPGFIDHIQRMLEPVDPKGIDPLDNDEHFEGGPRYIATMQKESSMLAGFDLKPGTGILHRICLMFLRIMGKRPANPGGAFAGAEATGQALSDPFAAPSSIDDLVTEFGRNLPENRDIDATLGNGIDLADSGEWEKAVTVFRDVLRRHPDYDVPHIWLADFQRRIEGPSKAVGALRAAAKKCRRKTELLEEAAELSLLECGDPRGAIHLFAQCIAAMEAKPHRNETTRQRACLFMKEMFIVFGDSIGAAWAGSMQDTTHLDSPLVARIHKAIMATSHSERDVVLHELPAIRDYLCETFPA